MLAAAIVRTGLALGTIVFAVIGTVRRGDVGWYAASGLMGTMWWLWDFFVEWLFAPIGAALARLFLEGGDMPPSVIQRTRPSGSKPGWSKPSRANPTFRPPCAWPTSTG